mgnify:CR=1 FL=1
MEIVENEITLKYLRKLEKKTDAVKTLFTELDLKLSKRNVTNSTKMLYLRNIKMLVEHFKKDNLDFLKDVGKVLIYINQFKFAKKKSLINSAMVGLSPESKTSIPEENQEAYGKYRDIIISLSKIEKADKSEQLKNLK